MTPQEKNKKILHGSASSSAWLSCFTLIELLVAMAAFLIIMPLVVQIFLTGVGGAQRLFARQSTLDSVRFILESMRKEIRMRKINEVGGIS